MVPRGAERADACRKSTGQDAQAATGNARVVIASAFITVLILWDLIGHLPLPLGVAGHEGSTVIVGLNGLRLLRAAAWRRGMPQLPAGGGR